MQVTREQIDPCKVALTITVDPDKVEVARKKAFAQAVQTIQLPGFRRGKVPPHVAKPYIDEDKVRQRAAELVIPDAYTHAVAEAAVEPFAQADFELVAFNPGEALVFKAHVPLRPVVTLGPYRGLSLERRQLIVGEAEIAEQLENIRARYAEFAEAEDGVAQSGDMLLVDLTAVVEGRDLPDLAEPKATVIEVGKNIPDLDNALVGLVKGDDRTIEAVYPETFQDASLRGAKATFTVSVKEVRKRTLPVLDDALVQRAHLTAKTVDELREAVRESLENAAVEMADNELEFNLVAEITKTAQIHFPEVLLRAEVEAEARQLEERLKDQNVSVEDYLRAIGKSADQVLQEISVGAAQRIRNSLALSEVARAESISVDDAEIDAKIAERAEQAKVSPAAVRAFAEKNNQMERFRDQALTEKILKFLKEASQIRERTMTGAELRAESEPAAVAPAPESEPVAEEKPKKRVAKKAAAEPTPEAEAEAPAAEAEAEAPAAEPEAPAAPKRRKKAAEAAE